jgi:hypothetical protein
MSGLEHLLVAETGTDSGSRYAVMAGVRVEDPAAVAERLADASDARVLEVLNDLTFEIQIAFASARNTFNPKRLERRPGYPLVAHIPEQMPLDFTWLDAYLTGAQFGFSRVRTTIVAPNDRLVALPRLVARVFHDAVENDRGRPGMARDKYNALAPLVTSVEDVGLNVSYGPRGNTADEIVRASRSS